MVLLIHSDLPALKSLSMYQNSLIIVSRNISYTNFFTIVRLGK